MNHDECNGGVPLDEPTPAEYVTRWTITNLDKSPAMTETMTPFFGTFEQAIEVAKALWAKITAEIGRTSVCVHSGTDTTYYYYRIDFYGHFTNRNVIPYVEGQI